MTTKLELTRVTWFQLVPILNWKSQRIVYFNNTNNEFWLRKALNAIEPQINVLVKQPRHYFINITYLRHCWVLEEKSFEKFRMPKRRKGIIGRNRTFFERMILFRKNKTKSTFCFLDVLSFDISSLKKTWSISQKNRIGC